MGVLPNPSSGSRNFEEGEGGKNMKYKPPHLVAIFFMIIFYRPGGGGVDPSRALATFSQGNLGAFVH